VLKQPDSVRVTIWILTCFLGGWLSGCATIDDLSSQTYRKAGIPSNVSEGQALGLLPMFGSGSLREFLPQANAIFLENFQHEHSGWTLIDPQESVQRIQQAGLDSLYRVFSEDYAMKNPPLQEPLRQIGEAVGTRYLLLTELQQMETAEGATEVRVAGRLWDAEMGETLWEGMGESRGYVFLVFPWVPSSFEKSMAVASKGLIEHLPY
jgi:hypothetical protein